MNARVIKVIVTDLDLRGKGTSESVYRRVTQYWTLDGELLAEVDPAMETPEFDRIVRSGRGGLSFTEQEADRNARGGS